MPEMEPLNEEELTELADATERIASKAAQNQPAAFNSDDIVRYAGLVARLIAMLVGSGLFGAREELQVEVELEPEPEPETGETFDDDIAF